MKQDSNTGDTSGSALQVSTIGHGVVISETHINTSTPAAKDSGIGVLSAPIAKFKCFKQGSMNHFLTSIVSAPSSSPLGPKRKQRGRPSFPNCDNRLKKPPSAEHWQQWQTILHWLVKEPLKIDQPQMAMRCTLCMDRLARGVLTGKNGRPACNAFTTGCVWFKKDQVERHFQFFI